MLRVQEISVHYGHVQAVRRASIEVREGEIVALLGPNGAGKSSLLNTIVGAQASSAGTIHWNEACLDGCSPHQTADQGLALVPEGRQLLHSMSVRDNLLLGGYRHHRGSFMDLLGPVRRLLRDDDVQRRMQAVFALFPRLGERPSQTASSLSGGEQQMLAIGRALMSEPTLMLLDEPSIGLAPNLVREILELLERLRQGGMTILLVEQDAHSALRIADRGYVMETGRIVADGTSRELIESPRMRRAYLGLG